MKKEIKVSDSYRTNPESLVPGGSVVEIHQTNGLVLSYDKIKNPNAYITRITKVQSISKVMVNGKLYWESKDGFIDQMSIPELENDTSDDLPF